jgi:hypothetical protein
MKIIPSWKRPNFYMIERRPTTFASAGLGTLAFHGPEDQFDDDFGDETHQTIEGTMNGGR